MRNGIVYTNNRTLVIILLLLASNSFAGRLCMVKNMSTSNLMTVVVNSAQTCINLSKANVPIVQSQLDANSDSYTNTFLGEDFGDGDSSINQQYCTAGWSGGLNGHWVHFACWRINWFSGSTSTTSLSTKLSTSVVDCDCDNEQICEYQERANFSQCWPDGSNGSQSSNTRWTFGSYSKPEGQCPEYQVSCSELAPDADGDGIPDADDQCPNDATNKCNDADSDGILNAYDPCPNDATNKCNDLPETVDTTTQPGKDKSQTEVGLNDDVSTQTPTDSVADNQTVIDTSNNANPVSSNNNAGIAPSTGNDLSDINAELNAQTGLLEQVAKANKGPCNPAQPDYVDCQFINSGKAAHTDVTATTVGQVFSNFYNDAKTTGIVQSFSAIKNVFVSGGSCPVLTIDLNDTLINKTVSTDIHCKLSENIRPILSPVMLVFYSIIGFRILASA